MSSKGDWLLICSAADYSKLERNLELLSPLYRNLHLAEWRQERKGPNSSFQPDIVSATPIFSGTVGRLAWKGRVPLSGKQGWEGISHVLAIQPEWDFPILRYLRAWNPIPVTLISRPSALSASDWQPQLQLVIPDTADLSSALKKVVRIYTGEPVAGLD